MGRKEEIQGLIEEYQAELALINSTPEDTFHVGTIALFASSTEHKWYYLKTGEEYWVRLRVNNTDNAMNAGHLYELILNATKAFIYFEIYILSPGETPIYAYSHPEE